MVRLLSLHNNTTINLGSARLGLNLPGNGEAVASCGVHFFLIMAGREILRHHQIAAGRMNFIALPSC